MIPYLLILFCAMALFIGQNWIRKDWPYYAFLVILVLFAGFRDMIGGYDIYVYGNVYEIDWRLILGFPGFEIGFRVFMILLKLISDKREFFIFATALCMLALHFKIIKRNSALPYFAVFIYFCKFFLFSFVYLRQGIAMGIIWLSIPYILERKYLKSVPFIIISFLFHHSALMFLPMLFFSSRKFTNAQLLISIFLFLILFLSPIGQIISFTLGSVTDNEKLSGYAVRESAFNFFSLIEILGFSILAFIFKKYFYREKVTTLIYNGFIFYIVVSTIGITNATFVRLAWYYFIFVVLAITYMYSFLGEYRMRTAFKALILAYYTSVFLRLLIVFDAGDFMPYKTIFQNFERHGRWEFMEYRKNK
jgi:transmembrane protein EpsG